MADKRRWYGGMKPVSRPEHEIEPTVDPSPPKQDPPKLKIRNDKPLQKGLPPGEESVE